MVSKNFPIAVGLEKLTQWYNTVRENQTNITIYEGYGKLKLANMVTIASIKASNKEDALNWLLSTLDIYSDVGGNFHVLATHYDTGGKGVRTNVHLPNQGAIAGIRGTSAGYQPPTTQQGIYGGNIAGHIAEAKAQAVEMALLKRDLEDIKKAKAAPPTEAPPGFIPKMGALMYEDPAGFQQSIQGMTQGISLLIQNISNALSQNSPSLGAVGYEEEVKTKKLDQPERDTPPPPKANNCIASMEYQDQVAFVQAWDMVLVNFPGMNPNEVMQLLLQKAISDPTIIEKLKAE